MRCKPICEEQGAKIVDPAGEYYDDYYAVFFLDPDGMKLEGMRYGEKHEQAAKKRAAQRKTRRPHRSPRVRYQTSALSAGAFPTGAGSR